MSMVALQFRNQLEAHLRRADKEGRSSRDILSTRLTLLRKILESYADQVKEPTISIQFVKNLEPPTPPSDATASDALATEVEDVFMCSQCHVRRSIREENIGADGLSFICDSCYLSNPPISHVDSTLDEIT
jgi:hypothetical protein